MTVPVESGERTSPEGDRLEEFVAAPKRAVWVMALPMMAGMAVHTLYVIVDTAFIGSLGTQALAAITFVAPLFFVMVTLTMGMGAAITALVAQSVGRRDPEHASRVAGTALVTGVGLGLLLTAGGMLEGRYILGLLGASGATVDLGWQYFQVIVLLVPFFFISTTFRSVLTGEGDARTPMVVLTASTVINLSLDALFIFGLGLGMRGAALATASAQLFSLVTFWALLARRKRAFVRFGRAFLMPGRSVLWQITRLAVPTAAGMLVMSFGTMALNRVLAEFGEVSVAGYGAANKVDMIVGMPLFGLAASTVTVIGMFAGAGRVDLIRSTALYAYRWALTLALTIGATAYLSSESILRIFTQNPQALAVGRTYLGFMIFAYPMMAIGITTGRLLQGLGFAVPSLVITSVRVLLIAVPVAYLSVYVFDAPITAVWGSILLGGVSASIISMVWVRHLVWRRDPTDRALETVTPLASNLPVRDVDGGGASAALTSPK